MKTMIDRASGYDLAEYPMQTSLESWRAARKRTFNPSRLIEAEACYVWEPRVLHIEIGTGFKESLQKRLKPLLYCDWRRLDGRVYATEIHLEHLHATKDEGTKWRLVKRAYPDKHADKCWDVGEMVFRMPTEELKIYREFRGIARDLIDPEDLDMDTLSTNAYGLAVCCSIARSVDILCETCVINVSGMRLADGICRLGQAYTRKEEEADQLN